MEFENLTLLVVVISTLIAWYAIKSNEAINRKRATLDLLSSLADERSHSDVRYAFRYFKEELKKGTPIPSIAPTIQEDIVKIFHRYEFIALGIHKGILDEDMCIKWVGYCLVNDYLKCKKYIDLAQKMNGKDTFCWFENLAKAWQLKLNVKT